MSTSSSRQEINQLFFWKIVGTTVIIDPLFYPWHLSPSLKPTAVYQTLHFRACTYIAHKDTLPLFDFMVVLQLQVNRYLYS